MAIVEVDISISVDGFVTGPNLDEHPGGLIRLDRIEVLESGSATRLRFRVLR